MFYYTWEAQECYIIQEKLHTCSFFFFFEYLSYYPFQWKNEKTILLISGGLHAQRTCEITWQASWSLHYTRDLNMAKFKSSFYVFWLLTILLQLALHGVCQFVMWQENTVFPFYSFLFLYINNILYHVNKDKGLF